MDILTPDIILLKRLQGELHDDKKTCEEIAKILDECNGRGALSLRKIEFFLTKYSRRKNISYQLGDKNFRPHISYDNEMLSSTRTRFEVFRRNNEKYEIVLPTGHTIRTTPGQLSFLHWAVKNGIIDYIRDNIKEISTAIRVARK